MAENVVYNSYAAIRDLLRSNLTDPAARGDVKWIRKVFPQIEATGDFPLITINQITTSTNLLGLNDASEEFVASLQIDVWIKEGNAYTISSESYAGGRLRDKIASDVMNELMTNKAISPNIYRVENTRFEDVDFDNEKDIIRKSMDFDIYYRWVK